RGREHLTLPHDHGADRHVLVLERALGLAEREPHVVLVPGEEVTPLSQSQRTVRRPASWPAAFRGNRRPVRCAARTTPVMTSNDRLRRAGSRSSSISSRYQLTVRSSVSVAPRGR